MYADLTYIAVRLQRRVTYEDITSHEAFTGLTSRAPNEGGITDMTAGSNHGKWGNKGKQRVGSNQGTLFFMASPKQAQFGKIL